MSVENGGSSDNVGLPLRLQTAIKGIPGMNLSLLARMSRVSLSVLRSLNNAGPGKRGPSTNTIASIAVVLKVRPGWLAYGEDSASGR